MAFRHMRLGFHLAAFAALVGVSTPSSATTETITPSGDGYYQIVLDNYDYDRDFDFSLPLLKEQPSVAIERDYKTPKPFAMKPRASIGAVLATTQAGWRSGRLRKLGG